MNKLNLIILISVVCTLAVTSSKTLAQNPFTGIFDLPKPQPSTVTEVLLTKKLTKQSLSLVELKKLCISWPHQEQLYTLLGWEFYALLLIDEQWWSAQYHYKPDVCGPIGINFSKGVRPLKLALTDTSFDGFELVAKERIRKARIFVGVKHIQEELVYLKELIVE